MMELELVVGIVSGIATLIMCVVAVLGKSDSLWERFGRRKKAAAIMKKPPPSSIPFPLQHSHNCDDHSPYSAYRRARMR